MRSSIRRCGTSISTGSRIRRRSTSWGSMRPPTRCCWSNGPSAPATGAWPDALALSLDFAQDGEQNLDSRRCPRHGRGDGRPDDSARRMRLISLPLRGWEGAEILPLAGDASFRRYFRVVARRAQRGADGRAAAARGPAAVHRGRRMAASARPQRAAKSSPATSTRACCCSAISATARLRETLDADPQRERELYELATDVLVHLHGHPPMPGLQAARPRPMARGAEAVHRLVLPGGRRRGRCRRLSRGLDARCWSRSRATASGR